MLAENLELIAQVKGLRQSDLARAAGVSRQAVSLWMKQRGPDGISARVPNMIRLAGNLGIEVQDLVVPLPDLAEHEASLIWDGLYPSVPSLVVACLRGEGRALARMVQVHGLLVTTKLFGRKSLTSFPDYKRHMHPVRRKQSEQVWKILSSPT